MDKEIKDTLKSLRSRHLICFYVENSEDAKNKILELIPKDAVVATGDSTTVEQIGVKKELKKRGQKMLDRFDSERVYSNPEEYQESWDKLINESTVCDVFLTGTNAITQDGRLVNVDATGNRVAGMFWGHPTSIIVVGRNKIVKDLDEAFHRIRTVIAPNHMKIGFVEVRGRQSGTPCAVTGECADCRATGKICNVFTIIEGKPNRTDITVVIVNEDLGLGWDRSWPKERITKIIENYALKRVIKLK